ncbi:restriction endonuclease subunit S [Acidithiobacillus sp.]
MSNYSLGPGYRAISQYELPDQWSAKRLGDLVTVSQGGKLGLTKESDYVSNGIPAYSAAGQDGFVGHAEFRDQPGVVLSAIGANCGRCFYADGDWTTLANVQAILPSKELNARFLYYRANIENYWTRSGSAQPFIKPSSIKTSWIAFPELPQQRRIAEILLTLDEVIEQTEALIAKHQQIKAGLMHDLFTRGVTPDGHLRPTREQAPDLYKESPLGWIPKEWEISQLGEVAEVNRGKFTIRPRNDPRFYGGQYPFIQTGDVSLANGRVLSTFSQTLNQSGLAVSRLFDEGTIMVTIAANIADTCVLGLPVCAPDSLVGVLPNKGQVSRFLQLCISRRKSWLEARAPQTAQKNINLEDLRPLLIPTPCQHEQEAIAAIYECVDFSLAASEQMVEKLRQQKHGLMHDLLTGTVRVKTGQASAGSANG